MSPLNAASITSLPLSAEPVSLWSEAGDLFSFLRDLHKEFPEYGKEVFKRGRASFETLTVDFRVIAEQRKAEHVPDDMFPMQSNDVIDFLADGSYGLMAKHAITWDAVVGELLSDDRFFSLPHILEAQESSQG